eukprot:ANDGO_05783.mRNA.1 Choline/ethanolaminephosphotransferase 2
MFQYVSDAEMVEVLQHRYVSEDHSALSRVVLQPYWTWVARLVPRTVSPNTLTALGLACILLPYLALSFVPMSVLDGPFFAATGLLVFGYQTLDAIDGKHARATQSAAPMGELWDHACDAISTGCLAVLFCSALYPHSEAYAEVSMETMLTSPKIVCWAQTITVVLAMTAFFGAHWEHANTHKMKFAAVSAPTEGLVLLSLFFLLRSLSSFSSSSSSSSSSSIISSYLVLIASVALTAMFAIASLVSNIRTVLSHRQQAADQSTIQATVQTGETRHGRGMLTMLVLVAVHALSSILYTILNPRIGIQSPFIFLTTLTLTFAHATNVLSVCSMLRLPIVRISSSFSLSSMTLSCCWMLVVMPLLALDLVFNRPAAHALFRLSTYSRNLYNVYQSNSAKMSSNQSMWGVDTVEFEEAFDVAVWAMFFGAVMWQHIDFLSVVLKQMTRTMQTYGKWNHSFFSLSPPNRTAERVSERAPEAYNGNDMKRAEKTSLEPGMRLRMMGDERRARARRFVGDVRAATRSLEI